MMGVPPTTPPLCPSLIEAKMVFFEHQKTFYCKCSIFYVVLEKWIILIIWLLQNIVFNHKLNQFFLKRNINYCKIQCRPDLTNLVLLNHPALQYCRHFGLRWGAHSIWTFKSDVYNLKSHDQLPGKSKFVKNGNFLHLKVDVLMRNSLNISQGTSCQVRSSFITYFYHTY